MVPEKKEVDVKKLKQIVRDNNENVIRARICKVLKKEEEMLVSLLVSECSKIVGREVTQEEFNQQVDYLV